MLPLFANPTGFWALLGVPAVVAIHFLQQRAKVARTSTWFLIEKLAPDSARGRTWDRLRASRSFWLQLAAVLLATWVLADPRWIRAESTQTVVVVLDASASMDAFRAGALAAAERELTLADGLAAHTTWIAMTTNPRQPPLYRGPDRAAALAALARWQPELGRHDLTPALRLARSLTGATGRTLLITDTRTKVPPDQRAAGVGAALENVGLAGATVTREENGYVWRALVKNHAPTPQRRTWVLESGGARSPPQSIALAAGTLTEISGRFPDGVERASVVLSDDGFAADNRLPLVLPHPKPLDVTVDGNDSAAEFFRSLCRSIDGVTARNDALLLPPAGAVPSGVSLRLSRLSASELALETHGGIFWAPAGSAAEASLAIAPITPVRDPLVAGLNWQGWLGTGPSGFAAAPGDTPLLWQGSAPLVFLRTRAPVVGATTSPPVRQLVLAFDWAASNAARLPATVLLARRFLEAERDAQARPFAANFDCGAPLAVAGLSDAADATLEWERVGAAAGEPPVVTKLSAAERREFRAPGRPGFFTLRTGTEVIVRGSAQFADARQGDFSDAEKFFVEVRAERAAAIERNTTPDPFAAGWLLLLTALVFASWWTGPGAAPAGPTPVAAKA
jgi:hypothetical protein